MIKIVKVKVNDNINWCLSNEQRVGGKEFAGIVRTENVIIFDSESDRYWATVALSDCVVLGDDQENKERTAQDRVDTTASGTAYTALIQLIGSFQNQ